MCELDGDVAGMMLGYRLSGQGETPKLAGLCQSLRPFSALSGRHPASFYVNTLAIYPRNRNRGLGAVLLEAAERKARKAHCAALLLEVTEGNSGAMRFYERHGFSAWEDTASSGDGRTRIVVLEKALFKSQQAD